MTFDELTSFIESLDIGEILSNLTREKARFWVEIYEKWTDEALLRGVIDQETAWDSYFALFHECELWELEEERKRIFSKIDTARYNPLKSKNPQVVILARIRLGHKVLN